MGQISSLVTSNELASNASSSKSQRRSSKKSRDTTKVQKAEDVPLYKGGCSVDELVEYIHNGRDPTVLKSTGADSVAALTARCIVLAPTVSTDRREQPPLPQPVKQPVKKKAMLKKDPTESDSGCGDCITADHQKDLMNSVDVQPLSCIAVLNDIVVVTPAVISLLDTVRSDVGALYEGSPADYDIETYTYDNLSSFMPSTEDEFMIVQRRRKGAKTTTTSTGNSVSIKPRRQLGKSSNFRSSCRDVKQIASLSMTCAASNEILPGGATTIDATLSSLESVSSYASANSSIRSNSPVELNSLDAVHSSDVSVSNESTSPPQYDHDRGRLSTEDVFSSAMLDQVPADSTTHDVEMPKDQRLFESIRSTGTFCFFADDENSLDISDKVSSSVKCPIVNATHPVDHTPLVSIIPAIQAMRVSHPPAIQMSESFDPTDDQCLLHRADIIPHKYFKHQTTSWSGLDEFCSVEDEFKLCFSRLQPSRSTLYTFGSVDFAPYASHGRSILPSAMSRHMGMTKRPARRASRNSTSKSRNDSLCAHPVRFTTAVAILSEDGIVIRFGFDCDALANVPVASTSCKSVNATTDLYDRHSDNNTLAELPPALQRVLPEEWVKRMANLRATNRRGYYSSPPSSRDSRTRIPSEKTALAVTPDVADVCGRTPTSLRQSPVAASQQSPVTASRQSPPITASVGHVTCDRVMHAGHLNSHFNLREAQAYFMTSEC